MLEKMRWLEGLTIAEMVELKSAILAHDLSLTADTITVGEAEAIDIAMNFYYDADYITSFVNPEVVEVYDNSKESE